MKVDCGLRPGGLRAPMAEERPQQCEGRPPCGAPVAEVDPTAVDHYLRFRTEDGVERAFCSLQCVNEILAMKDPLAPYVCLACGRRYEKCPDHDAYDCPACGGKVCPAYHRDGRRWGARHESRCHDGCEQPEVFRASGDATCEACGQTYYEHPGCFQGRYFEGDREYAYYHARVLCDGRHVHL